MKKVQVEANMLHHPSGTFTKGQILECSDEDAASMVKDKNVSIAPEGAELSSGIQRTIDPLDKALHEKDIEKAKDLAKQEGTRIVTPDPTADPQRPAPPERLPAGAEVQPIGRTKE